MEKIIRYFLRKKVLRRYYEEKAQEIMKEYLREDKSCIGIHNKTGEIKEIRKLKVIK